MILSKLVFSQSYLTFVLQALYHNIKLKISNNLNVYKKLKKYPIKYINETKKEILPETKNQY